MNMMIKIRQYNNKLNKNNLKNKKYKMIKIQRDKKKEGILTHQRNNQTIILNY